MFLIFKQNLIFFIHWVSLNSVLQISLTFDTRLYIFLRKSNKAILPTFPVAARMFLNNLLFSAQEIEALAVIR